MSKPNLYAELASRDYDLHKQAGLIESPMEWEDCSHQCSSECRRTGCGCPCGEYHVNEEDRDKMEWVGTMKQWAYYKKLRDAEDNE